jgi:hypothetical protein
MDAQDAQLVQMWTRLMRVSIGPVFWLHSNVGFTFYCSLALACFYASFVLVICHALFIYLLLLLLYFGEILSKFEGHC